MVGFQGEPGSNAASAVDKRRSNNQSLFVATDEPVQNIEQYFTDSKYFEEQEEGMYSAGGIDVEVINGESTSVEYHVGTEVSQEVVNEFVDEIIGSIDDVDPNFLPEIEERIFDETSVVAPDGGMMKDVDHGDGYSGVQESYERSKSGEAVTDGGTVFTDQDDIEQQRQTYPVHSLGTEELDEDINEAEEKENYFGNMPM